MTGDCPWSGYEPGTIRFCEERLCAWVVEPANAWSNLAYLAVGLFILLRGGRGGFSRLAGVSSVLVGIGSFAWHATGIFWGEALDLSAMFLISALLLSSALRRRFDLAPSAQLRWFFGIVLASIVLLLAVRPSGIPMFSLQIAVYVWLEHGLYRRAPAPDYVPLKRMFWTFGAATFIWMLDLTGTVCDPQNHILTGHAAWHGLTALCLYFFERYNRQFCSSPRQIGHPVHG